MSGFSDVRAMLVADLAPMGVTIHPSWPEDLDFPLGFITPPLADDWARRGNFGREFHIVLDLVFVAEHGPAGAALTVIENLVAAALPLLEGWALLAVDAPAPTAVSDSGAEYLASVIRVSKAVQL